MRTKDEPQIFTNPKCAVAPRCDQAWEIWCRGCCLTFCKTHVDRAIHACPSRDKRGGGDGVFTDPVAPVQREGVRKRPNTSNDNGSVHRNGSNGKIKK